MHRAPHLIRRQSLSTTVAKESSSAIMSASAIESASIDAFDLPYHIGDHQAPLVGYSHARRLSTVAKAPPPPMPAALLFDGPALTKQGRSPSRPHATSLGPAMKFNGPSRPRHAGTERVIVEVSLHLPTGIEIVAHDNLAHAFTCCTVPDAPSRLV